MPAFYIKVQITTMHICTCMCTITMSVPAHNYKMILKIFDLKRGIAIGIEWSANC